VRGNAVGFLFFIIRIPGFLSKFYAVWIFKIYYIGQTYTCVGICLIACVLFVMLPYDTYGKPLDSNKEEMKEKKLDNKV
jgi:hypothetical protein